jgi:hypothetical protein
MHNLSTCFFGFACHFKLSIGIALLVFSALFSSKKWAFDLHQKSHSGKFQRESDNLMVYSKPKRKSAQAENTTQGKTGQAHNMCIDFRDVWRQKKTDAHKKS